MNKKIETNLVYFCSETHYFAKNYSVLAVTLIGSMILRNEEIFKTCCEEILQSKAKCIIINFRDVTSNYDMGFIPHLESLFKAIREKPSTIRLSGVHPELKRYLQEKGIIQTEELCNNLADALNSIATVGNSIRNAA